ncbi:hypothetical protein Tco_0926288 [Tanacetum coccineum]|uniref:Zinc knuckle CX2CX4HX4C n=1 Tax=Tanacetum coccineum TaxID=301880 RepID=A0ABQ5DAC0_9ASTR
MINDEKALGANVSIPIAMVEEISDKFANTLYCFFIGEQLVFPIVEAYVKNSWAKYGFERVIFRNGFSFSSFCLMKDYDCLSMDKHVSSSEESGVRTDGKHKKKGSNKTAKKQAFRFSKPNNLIYRHVSKPVTSKEHTAKPNSNAPSSEEGIKGATKESQVSPEVTMNDSSGSTNENGLFKDGINLDQLRSTMDKLMDENLVLELNINNENEVLTNT